MYPATMSPAMISEVSTAWIWQLMIVPCAWPSNAATVDSVKPGSFAMLAKLRRRTCGVMVANRRRSLTLV